MTKTLGEGQPTATDVTSNAPSANQFSPNQQQTKVKRSGQTCNTNNLHNSMLHAIGYTLVVTNRLWSIAHTGCNPNSHTQWCHMLWW